MRLTSLLEALALSLRNLGAYKLRTALTTVGVSFGIFAISVVFALVNTLEYSFSKSLASLGNTVMFVHNWPWGFGPNDDWFKFINRPRVSYKDYQYLKENMKDVVGISYYISRGGNVVKANGNSLTGIGLNAVTYDFAEVQNLTIAQGRYFSPIEAEAGRSLCVVGANIVTQLFSDQDPIGKMIQIRGKRLEIVGVISKQGTSIFGPSFDDTVLVPYPLGGSLLPKNSRGVNKLIAVKAADYNLMPEVEANLIGQMRAARGLKPTVEDNFSINKQEALLKQMQGIFGVVNTGGLVIGLFSLLIGGVGIATIMFTSVKERTREIGIQKSVGATRGFILAQFLLEAVILCLLGGVFGIMLAGLTALVGQYVIIPAIGIDLEVQFLLSDVMIGLVVSTITGVLAGLLPAYTAAKMDPVSAIRQE